MPGGGAKCLAILPKKQFRNSRDKHHNQCDQDDSHYFITLFFIRRVFSRFYWDLRRFFNFRFRPLQVQKFVEAIVHLFGEAAKVAVPGHIIIFDVFIALMLLVWIRTIRWWGNIQILYCWPIHLELAHFIGQPCQPLIYHTENYREDRNSLFLNTR